MVTHEQRLARLRTKLEAVTTALRTADGELVDVQAAVDHDMEMAAIEDRPVDKALGKKLAPLRDRINDLRQNREAHLRAITRLEAQIQAQRDEAISLRVERLQSDVKPKLTRWHVLVAELAAASRDLLTVCEGSEAFPDLGGRLGLGQFLFPAKSLQQPLDDYSARCRLGRVFGETAEIAEGRQ